jgi:C4-dicarboxylate-binding protein DctP
MPIKLLLFLMLTILISVPGFAQVYVVRWGINHELEHYKKPATEFKERIEKLSEGKIKVEISYIQKPLDDYDHVSDLKNRKFDMIQEYVLELEKFVPEFGLWALPYLFQSDKHIENYILSKNARDLLKKLENFGLVGLDYTFSGGFIYFHGEKFSDFRDLSKFTLGLEPSSSAYKLYLSRISKAKISKPEANLSEIIAAVGNDLYVEAARRKITVNVTDHRVIARVLLISKDFLEMLPANLKSLLLEESRRMAKAERKSSIDGKKKFLKEASAHNLELNFWSKKQKKSARDLFAPSFEEFTNLVGSKALSDVGSVSK